MSLRVSCHSALVSCWNDGRNPCRSALDVVASFTTLAEIVSMHNLFLQEVVNGMVHVHVMYVCNPYVICESQFCQPAGA